MALPEQEAAARASAQPPAASANAALRALTTAIRRGDAAAFASFYDAYAPRLYQYLLALSRGHEPEAREVFQTVSIKLAQRMEVFEDERVLWAWLRRLAHNAFLDHLRARRRADNTVPLETLAAGLADPAAPDDHLAEALRQVLAECDPREAELLRAIYVDQRPLRELAAESGQTYKALESRLARLRQKLKSKLLSRLRHENRS
jgi:RNA polymerase sigma-70 factor (ECF subfamily)